ncbi:single-stranded DNA-binding protein [Gallid alphaherpesvirus 1]|uniref:Single-stranded DNA-binding protein n=1 Tax=Infectious laryngotracheitis virus TaxID=10386 RepID=F5B4S9_ILTV|nr:single-stranded DNA-binding protein [Gallid alphaherpesvirus 1]AEW67773.1 single-stranded DNA-binding protein [Gallid alphaherpesvirus 1]AEW67852.1 single-stranded DNA-binding protein [Gallid alphaherpesvirus 1]AFD36491.1 UL29 protein [Gallid alphaherpesvirus 1]AFD36570.1 UL29 protein [Gallid alphaherpesvirus 1]
MEKSSSGTTKGGKSDGGPWCIGPIGYVYARPREEIDGKEWKILCAKSQDQPSCAIAPLIRGLTVESDFKPNVAAVIGTKSSGVVGGNCTAILSPCHFSTTVYIFHGGECIPPTSFTPNLTKICEDARERFGFSSLPPNGPVPNAIETTGEEICKSLNMDPDKTMLYLVVAEPFCEAVYVCNTYIHYGSVETLYINSKLVTRIPIYPVQMYMPDIALRLCRNPFDSNSRNIGEGCIYPTPLFNKALNRLIHGTTLGTQGQSLRTRDLEAVARGAAMLAFDGSFEGCVLTSDKTFTELAQNIQQTGPPKQNVEVERRAACSLAAELALATRLSVSCAPYPFDNGCGLPYEEWPLFCDCKTQMERVQALDRFSAELAGIVGAAIFSNNSPLYASEVVDGGAPEPGERASSGLTRFYLTCGLHLLGCPQVDYSGKRVWEGTCPSPLTPQNTFEYDPEHLAYACGFSPELLSRIIFYLEKCSKQLSTRPNMNLISISNSGKAPCTGAVPECRWCNDESRNHCIRYTMQRLRTRFPIPRTMRRSPIAVIGAVDGDYTDCDILGNFAPYSQLKRAGDGEPAKAVMNDTYRGIGWRVFQYLVSEGLINKDTGEDTHNISSLAELKTVFEKIQNFVGSECSKFISALSGVRAYHYKEHLSSIVHTFGITLNPYSSAYCPVLSLLCAQTRSILFQDLILSQIHGTFDTRQPESKMFRSSAMPALRSAFNGMLDKGFLSGKYEPFSISVPCVNAPDTMRPNTEQAIAQYEYSLSRGQVLKLKEFKVKNRVVFNGSSESGSNRGRLQGMADAFLKPGTKTINILGGPLGFILKRDHANLFGKDMNAFRFWNLILTGNMPKRRLSPEHITYLEFIRKTSKVYGEGNFIKCSPTTLLELANFMLANKVLEFCDHGEMAGRAQYYISTPSMIITTSIKPTSEGKESFARAQLGDTGAHQSEERHEEVSDYCISGSSTSNSCRVVLSSKPIVMLGIMISKYVGQQNSTTVFQSGNWGSLIGNSGSQSVNSALTNDPVRKFALACKRVGTILSSGQVASGFQENTIASQVRSLIDAGGSPTSIYTAVLRVLGEGMKDITAETWMAITDDKYLVDILVELHEDISGSQNGWSVATAQSMLSELEGKDTCPENAGEMLVWADEDEDTNTGDISEDIELGAPSAKKPSLSADILFC